MTGALGCHWTRFVGSMTGSPQKNTQKPLKDQPSAGMTGRLGSLLGQNTGITVFQVFSIQKMMNF